MSNVSDLTGQPRMFASIAGVFVPVKHMVVEQSLYGSADAAHITSFLYGIGTNFGAIAQSNKYVPVVVTVGEQANPPAYGGKAYSQLFYGFLEEMDADWGADSYVLSARGVLALLIDQRISQRIPMNQDVGDAISGLITKYGYGMTAQVKKAGVQVGHVLTEDYVSLSRNVRVFDLIQTLAQGVGWAMRVKGTAVIVGPPPGLPTTQKAAVAAINANQEQAPIFTKEWQNGAGMSLTVKHNALHSHNIKVSVVSYINKTKSASSASSQQGSAAAALGLPAPLGPKTKTTATPKGRQTSTTSVGEGATNDEEYVFHMPGLTAAKCQAMANLIRDEISRHEFIADLTFSPTSAELATLVQASPEFAVQLTGTALHEQGHDQLYYPRQIVWTYDVESGGGLTCSITMVNHPIPTVGAE